MVSDPPELELQDTVSPWTLLLGTELKSSRRAANAPKHRVNLSSARHGF